MKFGDRAWDVIVKYQIDQNTSTVFTVYDYKVMLYDRMFEQNFLNFKVYDVII